MKNLQIRSLWKMAAFVSLAIAAAAFVPGAQAATAHAAEDEASIPMYRLYYRPTHEHLFTADAYEKKVLSEQRCWVYEGIAWYSPEEGDPVYRLFNPYTTDHLYTMDYNEYVTLGTRGWEQEGVAWYSSDEDTIPVYRQFAPSLTVGSHFYTTDAYEHNTLVASGAWEDENVAWYALALGAPAPAAPAPVLTTEDVDLDAGTFSIHLDTADAPGGVTSVAFSVWSAEDKSNLWQYDAAFSWEDGSWSAQATYEHHQALEGTYQVQAMVTGGDGVTEVVAQTTVEDPFRNVEWVPDSPEMAKARAYVATVTTPEMTQEEKLRACFDSFKGKVEKNPWIPHYSGPDWYIRYANSYFDTLSGNCLSYAAAFGYMAKVIGYDPVYACNSGGHGWIEIDGLVYDPEWALHHFDLSYYAMPYEVSKQQNYLGVIKSGKANVRLLME